MAKILPEKQHYAFSDDFLAVLKKHAGDLDAIEMLALAAQAVGMLVAFQDKNKYTPDQAMEIVARNLEHGNQIVLTGMLQNPIGNA